MIIQEGEKYYPYCAALEITLACNMRCIHCGSYANGMNRANFLSFEEWRKVIDDLIKLKSKHITFSGGEPFLYPKWKELVKYIKNSDSGNIDLYFISNGSVVKEDDIKFLKDNGLKHLAVSLDGNEKIHDFIRQHKGSFNKIIKLNEICKKYDLSFGVVTSINKHNFPTREEIKDIIVNNSIKYWQIQIVNSFGRAGEFKDKMLIEHYQYKMLIDDIYRWKKELKKKVKIFPADSIGYCHKITNALLEKDEEWSGCGAGKYVIGIEANGNVKGCLSLQHDNFIAGNVRKKSLIDIWNDAKCFAYTRQFDASKIIGKCKTCDFKEQCQCGCTGISYSIHNTIYNNSYCYKSIVEEEN